MVAVFSVLPVKCNKRSISSLGTCCECVFACSSQRNIINFYECLHTCVCFRIRLRYVLNEIFNFMSIHYSPFRSLCESSLLLGEMPKVNFRFLPYVMAYTSLSRCVMLCRNEQCSIDDDKERRERVLIDDGEIMWRRGEIISSTFMASTNVALLFMHTNSSSSQCHN